MDREALIVMIKQKLGAEAPQTKAFIRMCNLWAENTHNDEIVYNSYLTIMTHQPAPTDKE